MKTPMFLSKQLIVIVALATAMFTTACQNSSGSANVAQRNRVAGAGQNPLINPATGQPITTTQFGLITAANNATQFDSSMLTDFMWASSTIGYVSGTGQDNTSTGIEFRGNINQLAPSGQIEIIVKDSQAISSGMAFERMLTVTQVSGSSTSATVTAEDASGQVTFTGTFNGNTWVGTVEYTNSSGQSGSGTPIGVGNFQIISCGIFQC